MHLGDFIVVRFVLIENWIKGRGSNGSLREAEHRIAVATFVNDLEPDTFNERQDLKRSHETDTLHLSYSVTSPFQMCPDVSLGFIQFEEVDGT